MQVKLSLDKLKGIPKTLLIPLRGRYLETKRPNGIVRDPKSVEILDSLDHDFGELDLPWDSQLLISVRTEILDEAIGQFMAEHPDGVVVNLGCGLDTRLHRMDNGQVEWYELDLPEAIEIRKQFFRENGRCKFIPKSVFDYSWMDEVPNDRPTLFIAEGLFCYFTEEQVREVLFAIKNRFRQSEIMFEIFSPLMTRTWHRHPHLRGALSLFKWTLTEGRSMESWDSGIQFMHQWNYFDRHPNRWRWMRCFRFIPPLRKIMKVVHLRFNSNGHMNN
ncbi:MAG TPA: class I SAM-dependent methyltransferase [Anaerohalosphaeraceae bacterium]|jgi:O-methyltransferase involved in polyketide biosynthesis|nr:class I SAM-dependent methyltransferase [Anaerohalosphaeraceae bacterium]HRT50365.1 class I SAM-dependent methyltransferase [Anaerohalosphaeraceae bacterium]HRT86296.1 class I SAM-dependent methyltransferase [Anaerohalosphaeraceae bacterium]